MATSAHCDMATRHTIKSMNHHAMVLGAKKQFQKTEFCKFHMKGKCSAGQDCAFAHDEAELKPRPDLQKTSICRSFLKGKCPRTSADCPFAHGVRDLRRTESKSTKQLELEHEHHQINLISTNLHSLYFKECAEIILANVIQERKCTLAKMIESGMLQRQGTSSTESSTCPTLGGECEEQDDTVSWTTSGSEDDLRCSIPDVPTYLPSFTNKRQNAPENNQDANVFSDGKTAKLPSYTNKIPAPPGLILAPPGLVPPPGLEHLSSMAWKGCLVHQ